MAPIDAGTARTGRRQDAEPQPDTLPGTDRDEFVGFNLGPVGFIMRRSPFFAAVHRGPAAEPVSRDRPPEAPADSRLSSYVDSTLRFSDRDVPLFRLDDLLRDIFRIPEPSRLRAGLVARVDAFGPACAEAFRAAAATRLPGADTEYMAVGIGGDGAIRNVPWQELRPAPANLRTFLWARGIVACRFGRPGRIEYLIDPTDILLPLSAGGETTA